MANIQTICSEFGWNSARRVLVFHCRSGMIRSVVFVEATICRISSPQIFCMLEVGEYCMEFDFYVMALPVALGF